MLLTHVESGKDANIKLYEKSMQHNQMHKRNKYNYTKKKIDS